MRIAVSGAHRTGKTTLIENLREALPDYEFREEAYYELEEEGFSFSDVPRYEDYLMMLEYSIEQISSSGDNVIFDRCPIDYFAYLQSVSKSNNDEIHSIYNRVHNTTNEIDLVVFLPIEKNDLIGCSESELPELRTEVDESIKELIRDFNLNIIEVTGAPDVRTNKVISSIKAWK
ncbi:MAG: ATP-binding protein [Bacteroidetes bacterium]|nr:ATP-binding protein [Bacteroidota bacterium]